MELFLIIIMAVLAFVIFVALIIGFIDRVKQFLTSIVTSITAFITAFIGIFTMARDLVKGGNPNLLDNRIDDDIIVDGLNICIGYNTICGRPRIENSIMEVIYYLLMSTTGNVHFVYRYIPDGKIKDKVHYDILNFKLFPLNPNDIVYDRAIEDIKNLHIKPHKMRFEIYIFDNLHRLKVYKASYAESVLEDVSKKYNKEQNVAKRLVMYDDNTSSVQNIRKDILAKNDRIFKQSLNHHSLLEIDDATVFYLSYYTGGKIISRDFFSGIGAGFITPYNFNIKITYFDNNANKTPHDITLNIDYKNDIEPIKHIFTEMSELMSKPEIKGARFPKLNLCPIIIENKESETSCRTSFAGYVYNTNDHMDLYVKKFSPDEEIFKRLEFYRSREPIVQLQATIVDSFPMSLEVLGGEKKYPVNFTCNLYKIEREGEEENKKIIFSKNLLDDGVKRKEVIPNVRFIANHLICNRPMYLFIKDLPFYTDTNLNYDIVPIAADIKHKVMAVIKYKNNPGNPFQNIIENSEIDKYNRSQTFANIYKEYVDTKLKKGDSFSAKPKQETHYPGAAASSRDGQRLPSPVAARAGRPVLVDQNRRPVPVDQYGIPVLIDQYYHQVLVDQDGRPLRYSQSYRRPAPFQVYRDHYGRPVFHNQYGRLVYPDEHGYLVYHDQYGQPVYHDQYGQLLCYPRGHVRTEPSSVPSLAAAWDVRPAPSPVLSLPSLAAARVDQLAPSPVLSLPSLAAVRDGQPASSPVPSLALSEVHQRQDHQQEPAGIDQLKENIGKLKFN